MKTESVSSLCKTNPCSNMADLLWDFYISPLIIPIPFLHLRIFYPAYVYPQEIINWYRLYLKDTVIYQDLKKCLCLVHTYVHSIIKDENTKIRFNPI